MEIKRIEKSAQIVSPTKVWVGGISGETRAEVIDFALVAARETRGSLWDIKVSGPTDDGDLVVVMHKD